MLTIGNISWKLCCCTKSFVNCSNVHAGRAPDADVVYIVGVRDTQDLTLSVA